MPPPMADLRVCSPHMAKLQAASVPVAYGSCAPRLGQRDGRIAVSLNAPHGEGIITDARPIIGLSCILSNSALPSLDN